MSKRREFVVWLLALWALTFVAATIGTPPDPVTQLYVFLPGLVLAVPLAYWLVYRGGLNRMRDSEE